MQGPWLFPPQFHQHIERKRRPPSQQFSRILLQSGLRRFRGFVRTEVARFKASRPGRSSPKCACEGRKTSCWIQWTNMPTDEQNLRSWLEDKKSGDARCVGRRRHRGGIFVGTVDREGCRSDACESTGHVRRRISVSFSPWRGAVRTQLREARTSRCTARHGHRGTRGGEAAHSGPTRRLRTQATVVDSRGSDDEMLLLRRSIGPQDGSEQDLKGDVSLPQMFVMSDGSCLEQRGQCVASRPSRRLVLVPQSVDATPQSIQDREWDARVETYNRFSPLQDTQLEGSRPEDVAMTERSDIESCESAATQSGTQIGLE